MKLTPLIFIPYLLLIRKYRQAATATATFAATVALEDRRHLAEGFPHLLGRADCS